MKVIVQIPCYNEEATLAETLAEIPRRIPGVDQVEILIVDDGSTDRTVEVAREHGVDHVVRHRMNQGLASAFRTGLDACLRRGADVIVNTDADNQYSGADVPRLIAPILERRADVVVGDRQTDRIEHFSWVKKKLQRVGSWVVRSLSRVEVPDAVSGFRALSRQAALKTNILTSFSYTIEMLVQAGKKRMSVASVPVTVNPRTRESRLYTSVLEFIQRSVVTLVRSYAMYQPLKVFVAIGAVLMLAGALPVLRFLYFYFHGDGSGHVQSLVIAGVLLTMGFMAFLVGLVADLIAFNRQLLEIVLEKIRRLEASRPVAEEPEADADEPPAG
jgi:glycosyltransferase involved in cell wall biosynthesis